MDKDKNPIHELAHPKTSERLMLESFEMFIIKKGNRFKCSVFLVICILMAFSIGYSKDTVVIFNDIVDIVLTIILALFGIAFTGYTFFQALINGKLVELLMSGKGKNTNKFAETNESFVKLMMVYIALITISFLLKIISLFITEDFIFVNLGLSNILASLGILVYLYVSLVAIWHVKSFVYNIFQLFNMHAIQEYLDEKDKQDK